MAHVEAYLRAHERKSLLRFITCGSVDDGKSTLIGRLLYESKMILEDQVAALERDSRKVGTRGGELDFALLVDGLTVEREQGSRGPPGRCAKGRADPDAAPQLSRVAARDRASRAGRQRGCHVHSRVGGAWRQRGAARLTHAVVRGADADGPPRARAGWDEVALKPFRMAVQWVNRPDQDSRGFAGCLPQGSVHGGDAVRVLPSGRRSRIARVLVGQADVETARAGQSITVTLTDEIDVGRGDVLAAADAPPAVADQFEAMVVWMHDTPMLQGRSYLMNTALDRRSWSSIQYHRPR